MSDLEFPCAGHDNGAAAGPDDPPHKCRGANHYCMQAHLRYVAALEARLAEVGPVVEAAERVDNGAPDWQTATEQTAALFEAVRAMRAARSLRGAGEGNQEARKGEETKR